MLKKEELNPSPILFEVRSEYRIGGGEYIDPVYKHLGHEGFAVLFSLERRRIMEECGITLENIEADFGIRAYVNHYEVDCQSPVKQGDQVNLITSATMTRPIQLIFHHEMRTGEVLDAKEDCSYIILNLQNKPTRIPQELLERLNHVIRPQAE